MFFLVTFIIMMTKIIIIIMIIFIILINRNLILFCHLIQSTHQVAILDDLSHCYIDHNMVTISNWDIPLSSSTIYSRRPPWGIR